MSRRNLLVVLSSLLLVWGAGCAPRYSEVVRPVAQLNELSPELQNLTDAAIETYLKANVTVRFPTTIAVARLESDYREGWQTGRLRGSEAEGWQELISLQTTSGKPMINQVQLINPILSGHKATLKSMRDAAALVHAPVLLVYVQEDDAEEGQNSAAMAYWSIVGLFTVPGNTVGRYSVCYALLVDTQSGFVLATIQGEAKQEENVLPGAVDIARERLQNTVPPQALAELQKNVREMIITLAEKPNGEEASGGGK